MSQIINGKELAKNIRLKLKDEVTELKNADIKPNRMPPQILYHERSGDSERYGFYLNLADCETDVENVYGFDLVSKTEINGRLVLANRGVAIIKY